VSLPFPKKPWDAVHSLLWPILFAIATASAPGQGQSPSDAALLRGQQVAITFDDLPESGKLVDGLTRAAVAEAIIHTLQAHHVRRAYGFALGSYAEKHPEEAPILSQWLAAGFAIGNHTYHHPHLNSVSAEDYIADIAAEDAILAGLDLPHQSARQHRTFRFPYLDEGDTLEKRDTVRRFLRRNGYRIAEVTVSYNDWAWGSAYARCEAIGELGTLIGLKNRILAAADTSLANSIRLSRRLFGRDVRQIVLLHMSPINAITLDALLSHWEGLGVRLVSLDKAMADSAFRIDPNLPDECSACAGEHGRPFLERLARARGLDPADYRDSSFSLASIARICVPDH
jgi:peptidoglycan/xylan/chitin deacetylase (PgdA/CDA1 family)